MTGYQGLWISTAFLWIVIVVQTLVLIEPLRQIGALRANAANEPGALFVEGEGLPRGTPAPHFALEDIRTGEAITLRKKTLLMFLTTRCQACRALVPALNVIAAQDRHEADLVIICSNPGFGDEECAELARDVDPGVAIVFDQRQQVTRDYRVRRTPSATLLIDDTVRLHAIPNSRSHIEGLLDEEMSITPTSWPVMAEQREAPMASHS